MIVSGIKIGQSIVVAVAVLAAVATATVASRVPLFDAPMLAAETVAIILVLARRHLKRLFAVALVALLLGYVALGRGFAHLGANPIYLGEAVMFVGFLMLAANARGLRLLARSRVFWWLAAFVVWCAIRTAPYVATYGVDALRDGVIWGYSIFALFVVLVQADATREWAFVRAYSWALFPLLAWLPIALALQAFAPQLIPAGTDVPVLQLKAGDVAVHLAGAGAFIALGLWEPPKTGLPVRGARWLLWLLWVVAFFIVSSASRGAILAVLGGLALVALLRPTSGWWRPALIALLVAAFAFGLGTRIDIGQARSISFQQVIANISSVVLGSDDIALSGSREWRLDWWNAIVGYTVFGDYFLTGKGFGVNLADDDGFQVTSDDSLRSPHNSHLTVLARAGVPGVVLWIGAQAAFAWSCLGYIRRHRGDPSRRDLVMAWLLAYWFAFMINGAFDVFLEGPQAGVWFWTVVGLAVSLQIEERSRDKQLRISADLSTRAA